MVFVVIIQPRVDYTSVVWSLSRKNMLEKLEGYREQQVLRDLSSKDRLQKLNLLILEQRRVRGNLTAVYRRIKELEKWTEMILLYTYEKQGIYRTWKGIEEGKELKRYQENNFLQRCVEVWNGLKAEIVLNKLI